MRKLSYLLLVLALVLPLALPLGLAVAQQDPVVATLEAYTANLPKAYGTISAADLAVEIIEKGDALLLVDVRQPAEYSDEGGHLPGAINIPLRDLAKNLDALPDLDAEIVVYCGTGFRSSIAMTALQILGYTDVRAMIGGTQVWVAEGYAMTTEPAEAVRGQAPAVDPDVLAAVDAGLAIIPDGWGALKVDDFNVELIENPPDLLIDVRMPAERVQNGQIAGSVSMPLESMLSYADLLPADKAANIVVYCAVGHRGNMGATILRTLGYTNVRNLVGGFGAWATAGYAIEAVEGEPAPAAEAELDVAALLADYIAGLPASFNAIMPAQMVETVTANPDILLVDVRTADEYAEGHLEGAINIPLNELTDHLDLLPALDEPMIVYCGSGHRSTLAVMALNLLGYDNALSLFIGLPALKDSGLAIVTEPTVVEASTAPEFDPQVFALIDAYMKSIPANYSLIKVDDLNIALIENPPFIIDVRTPGEVAGGYIEGAAKWELRDFMNRMSEWPDPSQPIVIYELRNHRSAMAMMAMQLLGYENVRGLAGGLAAWQAASLPVVTD